MDTHAPISPARAVDLARRRPLDEARMVELAIEEVTAAILLASERRPSKVLVCNLAHWASAVDSARALADEVDVDIEFIARADGRGRDIVVRGR